MAEAHVADLDDFVADTGRHLRASWGRNVPLLVLVDDERARLIVDTVSDLEIVHDAHVRASREPLPGTADSA